MERARARKIACATFLELMCQRACSRAQTIQRYTLTKYVILPRTAQCVCVWLNPCEWHNFIESPIFECVNSSVPTFVECNKRLKRRAAKNYILFV